MGCNFSDINFNGLDTNQYISITKNPNYNAGSNYPFIAYIVTLTSSGATAVEIQGS